MTPQSEWLTESEAASYLRIGGKHPTEYLQRLCRGKKVLWAKRGRNYFFKKEWLDRLMLSNGCPALKKIKVA